MTAVNFLRLIVRNWKWLLALPILASIAVFVLDGFKDKQYKSSLQIYTGFASGYSITSTENQKFDYYAVNNALDNLINTIKSEAVLQKVGLTLFAQSMIYGEQGNDKYISAKAYRELVDIVPDSIVALINPLSVDSTVVALEHSLKSNSSGFVYKLIHLYHPNYSLWALSQINIKKVASSDMLEVSYESNDPALCFQTLTILGREFTKYYQSLKEFHTHDVVAYFESQLTTSASRLRSAEDRFMQYSKDNRVINYYEQTKAVAGQLQAFELDYDKILALNAGAKKSIDQLESKIGMHARLRLKSEEILAARNRIAERTAELTAQSVFVDDSTFVRFDSRKFDSAVAAGQASLRKTIDTMDIYKNSPEGIEVDNILNQWLDNVVKYDASTAALGVLDTRRNEINQKFDFFAPVGATVKRQEREIGINESEYLSLLNSLALAKLQQQNIAMSSSSLRVVDEPLFPIQAEASKRKMMAIVAFMATFMLILTVLLIIELTDRTLRDSTRAAKFSGLDVINMLPINGKYNELAMSQLMTQIIRLRHSDLPVIINLLSSESGEGKSYIGDKIAKRFETMGYSVKRVISGKDFEPQSKRYVEAKSILELCSCENSDVYIVELPSMIEGIVPPAMLESASLNLFVARANRSWLKSDDMLMWSLRESSQIRLYMVLNGVEEDSLEVFTGELPKSRSHLRLMIKRAVTRQFSTKSSL